MDLYEWSLHWKNCRFWGFSIKLTTITMKVYDFAAIHETRVLFVSSSHKWILRQSKSPKRCLDLLSSCHSLQIWTQSDFQVRIVPKKEDGSTIFHRHLYNAIVKAGRLRVVRQICIENTVLIPLINNRQAQAKIFLLNFRQYSIFLLIPQVDFEGRRHALFTIFVLWL